MRYGSLASWGLRQGTIPFLSRQGQATYGLPQVFERIDAIVEDQNDRRLAYRSRDWYRSLDLANAPKGRRPSGSMKA